MIDAIQGWVVGVSIVFVVHLTIISSTLREILNELRKGRK